MVLEASGQSLMGSVSRLRPDEACNLTAATELTDRDTIALFFGLASQEVCAGEGCGIGPVRSS